MIKKLYEIKKIQKKKILHLQTKLSSTKKKLFKKF